MARNRTFGTLLLSTVGFALLTSAASAAVITDRTPVDFTGGSVSFGFGTQDITLTDVSGGRFTFDSVGASTSGGGALAYLSFFNVPYTSFDPIRGGGSLTFDGSSQYKSLPSITTIGASALPTIIGLADTTSDGIHYGYARFAGTQLISYGFESVAGQAITITNTSLSAVPLPSSAPMFGAALLALGAAGYSLKRKNKAAAQA